MRYAMARFNYIKFITILLQGVSSLVARLLSVATQILGKLAHCVQTVSICIDTLADNWFTVYLDS